MASTPSIRIEQAGQAAGVAGQSRTDLITGSLVTAHDDANAAGTFSWVLVTPATSSATLSGANTATPTFTPDVTGNYLLFLEVDGVRSYSLTATGGKDSTQGGCGVLASGKLIAAPGETRQFDADNGWAAGYEGIARAALAGGGGGVSGPGSSTDNALARWSGAAGDTLQNGQTVEDDTGNVTVNGNLAVTGTVDGRDVATDGTKLDAIEGAIVHTDISEASGLLRKTASETYEATDTIGGGVGTTITTVTDQATLAIDCALGNSFVVTLAGNRTVGAPTNARNGQTIVFKVIQDATGSRTLTWNAAFLWPSGTAPTLTTTASAVDIVSAWYDGASWYAVSQLDLK